MSAAAETRVRRRPGLPRVVSRITGGIGAVGVKELRGRMRGRRAFVVLTVYLVLLGAFAWMVELFLERQFAQSFGGFTYASAEIGRGVFTALLLMETLLVALLAPAFTAGAISQERGRPSTSSTATPITRWPSSSASCFSALTYVFLLILASLPLTALVFVFGGVAPDDVVRGYVVVRDGDRVRLGRAVLLGPGPAKRTAATVSPGDRPGGDPRLHPPVGLLAVDGATGLPGPAKDDTGLQAAPQRAPEALLWLNPFVAQADVVCGTERPPAGPARSSPR